MIQELFHIELLAILASQALLKKEQQQNVTPVSIELRTSAMWV